MHSLSRLMSVKMTLRHVLYVSYLVPMSRVRPSVPNILALAAPDSDLVFISIVSLTCENVRAAILPWPSFNYHQLNLRTYVVDPLTGASAVYFLRSGVTSATTSALTRAIGLPWERMVLQTEVSGNGERGSLEYVARGRWGGEIFIRAQQSQSTLTEIPPFRDLESAIDHLTGPLVGFIGPQGHTKRFEIRHRALEVRLGKLCEIRFPLLAGTLLEEGQMQEPHNVLMVPQAEFEVRLPPRSV